MADVNLMNARKAKDDTATNQLPCDKIKEIPFVPRERVDLRDALVRQRANRTSVLLAERAGIHVETNAEGAIVCFEHGAILAILTPANELIVNGDDTAETVLTKLLRRVQSGAAATEAE